MNVNELRNEFRKLRENALYGMTAEAFDTEVRIIVAGITNGAEPTPEQWVEAAKSVTVKCLECQGSGVYRWGTSVNGRMSNSGPCYRCACKGFQNQEDFKRNRYYDNHCRRVV